MITVSPRVKMTVLQLKNTTGGTVHSTGDFHTTNTTYVTWGVTDETFPVVTSASNTTGNYTGHVRVSVTGTRRSDGVEFNLGIARFELDATKHLSQLTPLEADTAWNSWTNGGALGTNGLHSYFRGSFLDYGTFNFIRFYKYWFVENERHPVNNRLMRNNDAIDVTIKVEYLHRRVNISNSTNLINVTPKINANYPTSGNKFRPLADGVNGVTAANALYFNRPPAASPRALFIDQSNGFDYCLTGRWLNETSAAGSSRCMPFSELLKPDGLDKHVWSYDVIRFAKLLFDPALGTAAGSPIGTFAVDVSDPLNGGRPTLYHQTSHESGTTLTRKIGWTQFGTPNIGTTYTPVDNVKNGFQKTPTIAGQGNTKWLNDWAGASSPILVHGVDTNVRNNGRPALWGRQALVSMAVCFNEGTYAAPDYKKGLRIEAVANADNASAKFMSNATGIPADLQLKSPLRAICADDGWTYISLFEQAGAQDRAMGRMQYTGPSTKTIAEVWDWANWAVEHLWTTGLGTLNWLVTAPNTGTMTAYSDTYVQLNSFIDNTTPVNGYPVMWFFARGFLVRVHHNGGASATLSDNWTYTKVGGGTEADAPLEGTGFTARYGSDASDNWYHRKQRVGEWLYFSCRLNHYIGRVNIEPTSTDYTKFEILTYHSLSSEGDHDRF